MNPLQIIQLLGSLGLSGLGFGLGQNAQDRANATQINQINAADRLINTGYDVGIPFAGAGFEALQGINQDPYGAELQAFLQLLGQGGLQGDLLNLQGASQDQTARLGNLGNFIASNRTGPELGVAFDRTQDLLADPRFSNVVQDQGANARTDFVLGSAADLIRQGGRTPQLDALGSLGMGLVRGGGMTPEIGQLLSQLTGNLQQGGFSPEGRQLFQQLMSIVSGQSPGALLGMDVAVGDARNQAIRRATQAGEAARRNAFQTGGAGAIVGSGGPKKTLYEFEDAALTAEVSAVEQARASQQALQLQQLLGAAGTAGGLAESAQQTLASLFGTGGDLARALSQNIATGAGLAQGAEGLVASRLGTGFNAANATLDNELKRFQVGADAYLQQKLGGIENLLGIAGQDLSRQTTGLDALAKASGLNINLLDSLLKNQQFDRGLTSDILQGAQNRRLTAGAGMGDLGLGILGNFIGPGISNRIQNTGGTFGQTVGPSLLGGGLQGIGEFLNTLGVK